MPVELDEFFDMFDEETRRGAQGSLQASATRSRGAAMTSTRDPGGSTRSLDER